MSSSRPSRRSIQRRTTGKNRPLRRHRPLLAERLEDRMVLAASVSIHSPVVEVNGIAYFPGRTDSGDFQLWRSDGTSAGTYLLRDVMVASHQFANAGYLANVNGTLFFAGSDAVSGDELWKSDGTPSGTVLVKDLWPGAEGSEPRLLGNLGGTLFFVASTGSGGGLWKTDGTAAGTVQVSSVVPDYVGVVGGPTPPQAAAAGGILYFRGRDASGTELWKTDGTAAGTLKVKDIQPGPTSPGIENFTPLGGSVLFTANDGSHGHELWKSDGTAAGTVMVKDILPGPDQPPFFHGPSYLAAVGGTLFFQANDGVNGYQLWKSDGTEAGTVLVKNITGGPFGSNPSRLANIAGTLFFTANDAGPELGEVWKSDGTEAGTVFVKGILTGSTFGRTPSYFTNVGGKMFLSTANTGTGQIWKSDGTTGGTVLVKQFPPAGSSDMTPQNLVAAGGKLVFAVQDSTGDPKLWSSDGTAAGTVLLVPGTAPTCSTVVVNTNDSGAGSLRDAIICANSTPGTQTISFNIPGGGVHTISPASKLPDIFDPVVIDGYTQPGASANTNGPGLPDNAALMIEINGAGAGAGTPGLSLNTVSGATIRGLVINRFSNAGISVYNGSNNKIEGNFLGTDATGATALPNSDGVSVGAATQVSNNVIGGTAPAARNLISGNQFFGVDVIGGPSGLVQNTIIQGNFIGTNAAGTSALGNFVGIDLYSSTSNTTIGGSTAGAGNLISGNQTEGIRIGGGQSNCSGSGTIAATSAGNIVQGNRIGTDVTGTLPLGNGTDGIAVGFDTFSYEVIGGTAAGEGNIIAFNGLNGVGLLNSHTAVLGNSIFSNSQLGINLGGGCSVTPNDAGDADTGPNNLQNFPVVSSATASGSSLSVQYAVPSTTANSAYPLRIEFFKADSDGQEGQTFLGFDTYEDAEAGTTKTFSFTPAVSIAAGSKIVATATDNSGNTSEFSTSIAATSSAPSVQGTIFNDLDQDGVLEPGNGETPIAGRTVYIDLNNNGALDSPTEPSQITGSDGKYVFSGLPIGNVRVSQVVPLGSVQTGPVGPSDVLVSTDNKVFEYTRNGDLVQTLTVPAPVTSTGFWKVWDAVADQSGRIHVFQGDFNQAYISTYTPATRTWEHHTRAGLTATTDIGDNELSIGGNYLYVALTRFDIRDWSSIVFPYPAQQLTRGLGDVRLASNGKLYGHAVGSPQEVLYEFDPDTFALLRQWSLLDSAGQRIQMTGMDVTPQDEIFACDLSGRLFRYDINGVLQATTTVFPSGGNASDLDISADRYFALGQGLGNAGVIKADFTGAKVFAVGSNFTHAAFATYQGASPSSTSYFLQLAAGESRADLNFGNLSIANGPPTITSNGGGATASLSVPENTTAVTDVDATDADAGSTLTYSISGGADAAKFSIDSATGVLTFITAPNFESPTDTGTNNVYDLIVQVSDGAASDTQTIAVTVTNVNEAPVITSNGGGDTASISIPENSLTATDVNATDPDAAAHLLYGIAGGADSARFTMSPTTGVLTFRTPPNFESPTDVGADNIYDVIVQVSDGTLTDTQTLAVTVTNVSEPLRITSNGGGATASINLPENTLIATDVNATSDTGTPIVYSISGGADASKFSINATTGLLNFLAAPNFESPGDDGGSNVYDVVVQASDSVSSDTQTIAITVTNVNDLPTAVADEYSTSEDQPLAILPASGVLANDTDDDAGDSKTVVSVAGGGVLWDEATDGDLPPSGTLPVFLLAPGVNEIRGMTGDSLNAPSDLDGFVVQVPAGLQLTSMVYSVARTTGAISQVSWSVPPLGSFGTIVPLTISSLFSSQFPLGAGQYTFREVEFFKDSSGNSSNLANYSFRFNVTGQSPVGRELTLPSGALLTMQADGSFRYDPNGKFESLGVGQMATDSFNYTVADAQGAISSATVTITIHGENDAPLAADDQAVAAEDAVLQGGGILSNDTDPDDGDTKTIVAINGLAANVGTQITLPSGGLLTADGGGNYYYDPNGRFDSLAIGQTATDSFTYTVADSQGATSTATVTITIEGANDAPVAANDTATTGENGLLEAPAPGLLANDVDIDAGDMKVVVAVNGQIAAVGAPISLASGALLTARADGSFRYDTNGKFEALRAGQSATESFTYTMADSQGAISTATATITVQGANDAPVVSLRSSPTVDEGSLLSIGGSFSDVDQGDSWTATVDYGDGSGMQPLSLAADKTFQLSHAYADNGSYTVSVFVSDAGGLTGTGTVGVEVTNVAPQGLTFSGPPQGAAGQPVSFVGQFIDPGSADTHIAAIDWGDGTSGTGTVTKTAGGWQVDAAHPFAAGVYQVSVRVTDDDGGVATQATSIVVIGASLNHGTLTIMGSAQGENLHLSLSRNRLSLTGRLGGAAMNLSFANSAVQRIVANLGNGNDVLRVDGTIRASLLVDAGAGSDMVAAGGGPSLIVGGAGSDLLNGGKGRDVLIGGDGADVLSGGGGSDLLIAGTTIYDQSPAALAAILAEWTSSRSPAARTANLRSGSGPWLSGTGILLRPNVTVFDDGSIDTLMGGGDVDWALYDTKHDKWKDKAKGEPSN